MKNLKFNNIYTAICGVFALQCIFWSYTHKIKPGFIITPYPPSKYEVEALSFGDKQYLFRKLALTLQNAGDKFGHVSSLSKYDYKKLYLWFKALDDLDVRSNYTPFIASYYFGSTLESKDAEIVADYVFEYGKMDPKLHWHTLINAEYIYYYKVKNLHRAQEVAEILVNTQGIPLWARSLGIFISNKSQDYCAAYNLLKMFDKTTIAELKTNPEYLKDTFLSEVLLKNIHKVQSPLFNKKRCEDTPAKA